MTPDLHQIPVSGPGRAPEDFLALDLVRPHRPDEPMFLFLHGLGACRSGVKATHFMQRAQEQGVGLCRLDLSCHGESSGSMRAFTLSRAVEDVAAAVDWLKSHGHGRIVGLGSSFGALAAMWLQNRRPGSFDAVCCLAPALGLRQTLRTIAGDQGMALWKAQGWVPYANDAVSFELGIALYEELVGWADEALAEGLAGPVQIIHGMADETIPHARATEFAARLAGERAELVLLPGAGHSLTECRERVWELVVRFAQSHEGGLPG